MRRYLGWISLIISFMGAVFAGWVDFNNNEPQAAVLVILTVTFVAGWIYPAKAWLWAIIVALGLPGVYLSAVGLGYHPVSPPSPGWYASLIALIPAFLGAYAGVLGGSILYKARGKTKFFGK